MSRARGLLSTGAQVGLVTLLTLVAGWLACWHLWLGALWWGAVSLRVLRGGRTVHWLVMGLVGVLLVPWCLAGYDARSQLLMARVSRQGPDALTAPDLMAITGMNVVMGGAGMLVGFPEVGLETLMLTVPSAGARTWTSDRFPVCAPKVAAVVERHRQRAERGGRTMAPERVAWSGYGTPGTSIRGALALNPAHVGARVDGELLRVETVVAVDYPPGHRLELGRLGPLTLAVEEGLFHAAEARGWLHPYTLTYTSHVPLTGPLPAACEAWSVRLANQISTLM